MYTLSVPPFVEVTIATTEEQMDSLRRQYAFVKPPLGGTSRSNLDDVLKQWSQQVVLADMRDPSLELSRLDGAGPLSASTITQAVGGIIDNFDGVTHQDDVFYLVYPPTNSRRAAGIRNTLQVLEGPETIEQEINGVLYRQKRPFTYWLPTPCCSTHSRVKLAFYQSVFFQDEDGPNGWRLLKHSPNASDSDLVRIAGRTGTPRREHICHSGHLRDRRAFVRSIPGCSRTVRDANLRCYRTSQRHLRIPGLQSCNRDSILGDRDS